MKNQREKKTNLDLTTDLTIRYPPRWAGKKWTEKNIWRQSKGVIYNKEGKEIADVLMPRAAKEIVEAHNMEERAFVRTPFIEVDETMIVISKILTGISDGTFYHVSEVLPQLIELRDKILAYKKKR